MTPIVLLLRVVIAIPNILVVALIFPFYLLILTGNNAEGNSSGGGGGAGGMSGIFGNTCFKACGMEDIQYAARSAGDTLITLRTCFIILTIAIVTSLTLLTISVIYIVCRKAPPSRRLFPLPSFVRDVFPQKDVVQSKEEVNT